MSNLKEILDALEKLKEKCIVEKNYEKAANVMQIIKSIKEKLC